MNTNFQSEFSIVGYGSIYAGKLIEKHKVQEEGPIIISQDYLAFTINFGIRGRLDDLVAYQLIWDGEYYMTDDITTVDLALSFKDLDMGRANIHKNICFDLLPLRFNGARRININLMGNDQLLLYEY